LALIHPDHTTLKRQLQWGKKTHANMNYKFNTHM
jgi:hypothetical protein